jgi:hypothetical protein
MFSEMTRYERVAVIHALLSLRKNDPAKLSLLLAERHVQRGKKWLNKYAPHGWHRNLFEPCPGGRSLFRAMDCHADECVLALAFEFRSGLSNIFGRVSLASVADHFHMKGRFTSTHGFSEFYNFPHRNSQVRITTQMLDAAWEKSLRSFYEYKHVTHHHPFQSNELRRVS